MSTANAIVEQAQPDFRSILFATDYSTAAGGASEWLKVVAGQLGSAIVLTHFKQIEGTRHAGEQPVQLEDTDGRLQAVRNELCRTGDPSVSIAPFQLKHEMPFAAAAFEAQLREIIDANSIDLIVLGTHARQGLKKLALGSFAEGVFRHADVPVLVIGPKAAATAPPQAPHKVLFATDFERESIEALPLAAAFAKQLRASLVLLNVNQAPRLVKEREDAVNESVDRLRRLAERFAISGATLVGLQGNPTKQIARYIKQESISTVVLGIRSAEYEDAVAMHIPTLVGNLISSVTCSVLTFRGKYQSHGYQARPTSGF